MKKFYQLIVFALVYSAVQSAAFAVPSVDIKRISGYYATGSIGGELTIGQLDATLSNYLGFYGASTKNQGFNPSLQSFCLEKTEGTAIDVYYQIDGYAILGGGGAVAGQDPISDPTAWLYKQFAKGTLSGYNYTVVDGLNGRSQTANSLQNAVWFLEQEHAYGALDAGAKTFLNTYVTTVLNVAAYATQAQFESLRGIANAQNGVAVFNPYVYDAQGKVVYKQSQLILVPAPGALILGSLGMAFVNYLRGRRKF